MLLTLFVLLVNWLSLIGLFISTSKERCRQCAMLCVDQLHFGLRYSLRVYPASDLGIIIEESGLLNNLFYWVGQYYD